MKRITVLFVLALTLMMLITVHGAFASSQKAGELTDKNQDAKSQGDGPSLSGKVVETMDSGGYTYISLKKNDKTTWVAVPQTKVTVGQEMSFAPGMVMKDFKSTTLNRTFESIVFSSGAAGQEGHGAAQKASAEKQEEPRKIKVEKAAGPNAYTVAELYEKSAALDKKNIVVKGQVVKISQAIMSKNWIHIQDGSGDPSKGTNDIVVTSQDLPAVGDVVTAKGTLYKNKDFGSGYKYAVIIEETSIKK